MGTRLTPPPQLDKEALAKSKQEAEELAPKYHTELLKPGPLEVIEKLFK